MRKVLSGWLRKTQITDYLTKQVQKLSSQQPGLSRFLAEKVSQEETVRRELTLRLRYRAGCWVSKGFNKNTLTRRKSERTEQSFWGQMFPIVLTGGAGGQGPVSCDSSLTPTRNVDQLMWARLFLKCGNNLFLSASICLICKTIRCGECPKSPSSNLLSIESFLLTSRHRHSTAL